MLSSYRSCFCSVLQTISDFAGESGKHPSSTPRPGSTPVRVTSAVRSSKGVVYGPTLTSTTPGGGGGGGGERGGSGSVIPLLTNTRGIFITLESHQVRCRQELKCITAYDTGSCHFLKLYFLM